ncbi:hypothetical protein TSUD_54980 [Trifolium subterraneum]|uniref:RNase H type-1 domain-containing protein n=1 Tax=Trifolium subterraneum TaxID=3900 RepID=A0A2Z6NFU3_TRISU|nr:hypothetical protein TSUD_54980 [Trifolium subterraneum]
MAYKFDGRMGSEESLVSQTHYNIHHLFGRDYEVVVDHTLREDNTCVDMLTKMGTLSLAVNDNYYTS